ncbi:hypothetical protein AOQ84DRAFT_393151 [Glonium stellatum]|uniref:Nuclear RNA binding protein n=1 Tax=Glonium stellatum TaxID=574774 RepID=A0A8E2JM12_9PEZI|nr:hypothetical protein AOQ84DRAFT_393151 [Glonium stellatum]
MAKSTKAKHTSQTPAPNTTTPLASADAGQPHGSHTESIATPAPDVENSRKRGYDTQEERYEEHDGDGLQDANTPLSKRRRSSNWPLPADDPPPAPEQQAHRKLASPVSSVKKRRAPKSDRPSKFLEGSMNDKASEKPPSVFTRIFQGGSQSLSVDHLMEDYIESSNEPSASKHGNRPPASPSKATSHNPSSSVSSMATGETKRSGIYRFGRSIASSFNPGNIWQKVTTGWKDAKEELIKEELDDRKTRAEQAYAELKKSGQLGATKVFVRGAEEQTPTDVTHRDSSIQMDDVRSSSDQKQSAEDTAKAPPSASSVSGASETRKSSFHFRTPSLSNLKKAKSNSQLNSQQTPTSSQSPEKEQTEMERTIRKSQSKKDLQKQQKLTKRVSDLETKLEEARRELNRALGDAPPVPALPPSLADAQTPSGRSRSSSPQKKVFVPGALPSLPSERLLFPEQLEAREEPGKAQASLPFQDIVANEKPAGQPLVAENAVENNDIETTAMPQKVAPKRKVTKKRRSANEEDLRYKPQSESDDDGEWEAASKTSKKRNNAPKAAEKPNPKSKKQTVSTKLTKKHHLAATDRPQDEPQETTTKTVVMHAAGSATSLTTVPEEHTIVIPLSDVPSRPTAFATPSHPTKRHTSHSPAANKLSKRRDHSHRRSTSPPPSSRYSKGGNYEENDIVSIVPDGASVPPMPSMSRGIKNKNEAVTNDNWEGWDDEIF